MKASPRPAGRCLTARRSYLGPPASFHLAHIPHANLPEIVTRSPPCPQIPASETTGHVDPEVVLRMDVMESVARSACVSLPARARSGVRARSAMTAAPRRVGMSRVRARGRLDCLRVELLEDTRPRSLRSFSTERMWPASRKDGAAISGTNVPCPEQSTTTALRATTASRPRRPDAATHAPPGPRSSARTLGNLQSETVAGRFEIGPRSLPQNTATPFAERGTSASPFR
jgi:hypothetical protein